MQTLSRTSLAVALAMLCAATGNTQTATAPKPATGSGAPAADAPQRDPGLYMNIQTDMGGITCKLFEQQAPNAVRTIVGLAIGKISYVDPRTKAVTKKKFYDGLVFHRVIPEFMIQGGDPLGTGYGNPGGPGFPYKNEVDPTLKFDVPGRLALANEGNNNSNGSQFFITEVPYASLNGGYTIFGQCDNVDIVKAIARVKRDSDDKPLMPVHIQHITVQRVGPVPPNAPEVMPKPATPAKPATTTAPKPVTGTAPKPTTPATH